MRSHPALAAWLAAAIPRLWAWWYFPTPEPNYNYWLSESLLTVGTFSFGAEPTSFIEPVYPAVLAVLRAATGSDRAALFVQAMIAASACAALYRLTTRISSSPRAGLCAAALFAFDPYFVRQSPSYIELPLLLPLFLWALERTTAIRRTGDGVAAGALLGVLLLARASLLPAIGGAIAVLARRHRGGAVVIAVLTAVVVFPWTLRSYRANDTLLPTRVGENLFVSTSEYAVGVTPVHDVDLLVRFAQLLIDKTLHTTGGTAREGTADQILIAHALAFAAEHPLETARLKLWNLVWIPSPLLLPRYAKSPHTHAAFINGRVEITGLERRPWPWEVLHAGARTVLLLAALVGLRHRRGLDDQVLLIVLASEIAVHTVFFPTTRLLGPFTAVLMVYAGIGLSRARSTSHQHVAPGTKHVARSHVARWT